SNELKVDDIVLLINEVRADSFNIYFDKVCITDENGDIDALGIPVVSTSYNERVISWVDVSYTENLTNIDAKIKSAQDE
ncbi:EscV/YscV/HrcV family type III secretion system export apparatus protein, partial [Shigella sonnei]